MQGLAAGIWGFLPFFLLDIGGSPVDVGILAMAPGLASTLMQLAWGRVSDRMGHSQRMASYGFLFTAVLSVPIILSNQTWQVILSNSVQAIFGSVTQVATVIMLIERLGPRHGARFMGFYNPMNLIGSILGSLGAGLMIPRIGYQLTFMIYTFTNIALALTLRFGIPDTGPEKAFGFWSLMLMSFKELAKGLKELPEIVKVGGSYTRWVVGISIRGFGLAMFGPVLTVYLVRALNASTPQIGSLNSISYGVRMLASPPLGIITDRKGAKRIMLIGIIVASTYPLLCAMTSDASQMVPAYLINGLFWACIESSWLVWQMSLIPGRRGIYTGLLNFVNGLMWAIGPLLGGFLSEFTSIYVSALFSSPVILLSLFVLRKVPERADGSSAQA
jgi:MFS family permease